MLAGALLILIVIASWALFIYVFKARLKFSFIGTPLKSALYFLAWTFLLYCIFPSAMRALFAPDPFAVLVLLLVLLFVCPAIYAMVSGRGREDAHPDLEFLRLKTPFLIAKPFDILFQQSAFGIFLLMASLSLSLPYALMLFVLVFAIIHSALYLRVPARYASYFFISAAVLCFPLVYLLLFVPGGVYYAIALHMLWYVLGGALLAKKP